MKVYNINTKLRLLTNLSIEEITLIAKPFVDHKMNIGIPYDNDDLLRALKIAYPGRVEELIEIDITI
jgi:hypothetical protein